MHDVTIIFTYSIGSFAPVDFHWGWIVFSLFQDLSHFSHGVDGHHPRNFPWSQYMNNYVERIDMIVYVIVSLGLEVSLTRKIRKRMNYLLTISLF